MRLYSLVAAAAMLSASLAAQADTFYPSTGSVAFSEVTLTVTPNSSGLLFDTIVSATNTGAQSLTDLYLFSTDVAVDGQAATLTSTGDYTVSGTNLFADATNAAVFITPSQTNVSLDPRSSGSNTVPEIPGFLIANSLDPGQTVDFDADFEIPQSSGSLTFDAFPTANIAVTPEPSSILLLGTGLLGLAGVMRKRFA